MGPNSDLRVAYEHLHRMNQRATQLKMMHYKLALQLYKNFNAQKQGDTWLDLNFQQNYGQRNKFVMIVDNSTHKVGRINLINRLNTKNCKVKYESLNLSLDSYKVKCKSLFLN